MKLLVVTIAKVDRPFAR